ncbi:Aminopeptidase O [Galemys pyrenaicus]|uniref:Aminopeptidase O n=1 Tax=Galemys pyrenaicus TaxID=202257 RepID=A0A8J5ZV64_GALPY|nr:Aminopeptidase O [Galemys pyrenaicus]
MRAGPQVSIIDTNGRRSTLTGVSQLCGTRLCHEIAHAWFGLAIGARDWTEEWLSEGFATHLEDVFWAEAQQQLAPQEAREQQELRACLRWKRLQDEVRDSSEELQVLSRWESYTYQHRAKPSGPSPLPDVPGTSHSGDPGACAATDWE